MLVLFETPAGYALFSANEKKLSKVDNIYQHFATADGANEVLVDLLILFSPLLSKAKAY
jgi:hypothetical protein